MLRTKSFGTPWLAAGLLVSTTVWGQSVETPQTRLRPIGSPSAVDQFRRPADSFAGHDPQRLPPDGVRQTVWMQGQPVPGGAAGGLTLPGDYTPPAVSTPPSLAPPPPTVAPSIPRTLPSVSGLAGPSVSTPSARANDYAPIPTPQLGNQFATLDNSCHVSGPSTYTAASASGCGCAPVSYQAPVANVAPTTIPGPTVTTPVAPAPVAVPSVPLGGATTGVPAGALISFGQERYPVQVGQGLFGQPVAYVPGQRFRNWIRYLFP